MTQEQLADATGLTSVHVNRVLKGLEADGLITRRRRHIYFPDWRALQDAGDFSRAYLHLPGGGDRPAPPHARSRAKFQLRTGPPLTDPHPRGTRLGEAGLVSEGHPLGPPARTGA